MTKYYKVLGEGLRTKFGYQWEPGKWNIVPEEEIDHNTNGKEDGAGLHVFMGRPNWNYQRYIPDHTYEVVDVSGLLGSYEWGARFRKVKLAPLPLSLKELLGKQRDGFKGVVLSRADLTEANLSRADLSNSDLYHANLNGANLSGASLCRTNLRGANLSGANLRGANLAGADLVFANLSEAKLSGAVLAGANLTEANLSYADLRGANLMVADLMEANLTDADLTDVVSRGADFTFVNMTRVKKSTDDKSGQFQTNATMVGI